MNYYLGLLSIIFIFSTSEIENENQQQEVLQSVFNIEEFQKYLAYSPRFIGTSTRQEVLMLGLPELEDSELQLKVRDKSIRIISERDLKQLDHNFFIKIDEFEIKKSTAKVLLSYRNSRLYYEKKQKILLDAQLEKNEDNGWVVENYNLYEVIVNTSD